MADIYKTKMCPLAKVMRRELKTAWREEIESGIFRGEANETTGGYGYQLQKSLHLPPPGAEHKCTERRDIPGSVAFVPSVVGLIIAGEVIKDLTVEERAIYFN